MGKELDGPKSIPALLWRRREEEERGHQPDLSQHQQHLPVPVNKKSTKRIKHNIINRQNNVLEKQS